MFTCYRCWLICPPPSHVLLIFLVPAPSCNNNNSNNESTSCSICSEAPQLISSSHQPPDVARVVIPILQMRKLRLRAGFKPRPWLRFLCSEPRCPLCFCLHGENTAALVGWSRRPGSGLSPAVHLAPRSPHLPLLPLLFLHHVGLVPASRPLCSQAPLLGRL